MSLMKMVTKVAVGIAVAKGMQKVQQSGGIGNLVEGLTGGGKTQPGGGLEDILGQLAGGGASGGLGGLLGQLGGGTQASSGGLGDLLGQLGGGGQQSAGGLGDMLGQLAGGDALGQLSGGLGGIGGLLGGLASARGGDAGIGQSLEQLLAQDNPADEPGEDEAAGLMIRAMIMAARSDGEIDGPEKEVLMGTIGADATPDEKALVQNAMAERVDAKALAADTPRGMETQVYSMSVMSINPDSKAEAAYLHSLAGALGIGQATVNEIHDSFRVERLYS